MQTKHTPGPWTVEPFLTPECDDDPQGVYKVEPAFSKLTKAYETAPFCQDDTTELDAVHAENHANARLIASAPELLEAAKWVWDHCNESDPENAEHRHNGYDMLRAAILKAQGSDAPQANSERLRGIVAEQETP